MKLLPIDITKAEKHECPDVKTDGTEYLCVIDGRPFAGRFNRQWYGLNFYPWLNGVGIQFDAPGSNRSTWQALWEIQHDFKPFPRPDPVSEWACSKYRNDEHSPTDCYECSREREFYE